MTLTELEEQILLLQASTSACLQETVRAARSLDQILESVTRIQQLLHESTPKPTEQSSSNKLTIEMQRFGVTYLGNFYQLGNNQKFRLLAFLVVNKNHFQSHEDVSENVMGGKRTDMAVRTAISRLRQLLRSLGLDQIGLSIDGTQAGHYVYRE